ncbi:MAG: HAMP domain-containing sensor histidine kinase [Candidatus Pacebacteria bacterium]|nr:HAMP domain-containing sensor histidine kinase [Candidatus Paceibacterota bacterium]MDR3582963.1 HAMP domain-containing sensor histidine kinase [Candidatus Paceibacterota bacterium]
MPKNKMRFINDINLKKQADDLGVKVWQTPSFLFIMMGLIAVIVMTATYYISERYNDPRIVVVSESIVVSVILIIGTIITRMVDEIIRLDKMKSDFVSVASHQLRTPLSAVKWETEILLEKENKGLTDKQLKNIESIAFLNQRMIRLVNDLLDVARIEQKRLIIRQRRFDFAKLVGDVFRQFQPTFEERHLEVVLNVKKNLPWAVADPEKIKIVVENLIGNAVKYTTSGGKVETLIYSKDGFLIFEVKDNGVGIPEEQISRIFNKFFRSDNAVKYQTEGTGLGLYIAKNIVEQSRGKIWFQSIENVGSLFAFSIPEAKEEPDKTGKND